MTDPTTVESLRLVILIVGAMGILMGIACYYGGRSAGYADGYGTAQAEAKHQATTRQARVLAKIRKNKDGKYSVHFGEHAAEGTVYCTEIDNRFDTVSLARNSIMRFFPHVMIDDEEAALDEATTKAERLAESARNRRRLTDTAASINTMG